MKKHILNIIKSAVCTCLTGIIIIAPVSAAAPEIPPLPELRSECAVIIDAKTGYILAQKNSHKRIYPASITKILTAAVVLENSGVHETATTSSESVGLPYGATALPLGRGEEADVDDLLYAMMLVSANDAANVLAEHSAGSLGEFVRLMNRKARDAGAFSTRFENPSGLHDDNHMTTAYDMALITKYALETPGFREIFGTESRTLSATNLSGERRVTSAAANLGQKRPLYEITGAKTGWTPEAHGTMVTLAAAGDFELICVVTGGVASDDKYTDTEKLLDYGFANFTRLTVGAKDFDFGTGTQGEASALTDTQIGEFVLTVPKGVSAADIRVDTYSITPGSDVFGVSFSLNSGERLGSAAFYTSGKPPAKPQIAPALLKAVNFVIRNEKKLGNMLALIIIGGTCAVHIKFLFGIRRRKAAATAQKAAEKEFARAARLAEIQAARMSYHKRNAV